MSTMLEFLEEKIKDLTDTEKKLIRHMQSGEEEFAPGNPPDEKYEKPCEENTIRGEILRLIYIHAGTDGFSSVPRIKCAYISGKLDLENLTINSPIRFTTCLFEQKINFCDSIIKKGIFLQGSKTPGILGDRVTVSGPVLLRHGFESTGTISFSGAKIESDVDLRGAHCTQSIGKECINLESSIIHGNLLLAIGYDTPLDSGDPKNNKRSHFKGRLKITNTKIYGNLKCSQSQFETGQKDLYAIDLYNSRIDGDCFLDHAEITGGISLWGATVSGDIHLNGSCFKKHKNTEHPEAADRAKKRDRDLSADGLTVEGAIYLHNITFDKGDKGDKGDKVIYYFSFNHARAETIADDMESWSDKIDIDGFYYKTISKDPSRITDKNGDPDTPSTTIGTSRAKDRITWLEKQESKDAEYGFMPQPWKHLMNVLRGMGHYSSADEIGIKIQENILKHKCRFFLFCYGKLVAFGYKPTRLIWWMLGVWLSCAAFYWFAAVWTDGVFAPSNPMVFQHPHYQVCAPQRPASQAELAKPPEQQSVVGAGNWYLCGELREEYTGFSPLAYSLDVILPLVDLQQQKDWGPLIPTPKADPWEEFWERGIKHLTRLVIWTETLFGWVASLLLVAIVSGLTKRRED